jgi:Protein of unknown function (DUF1761)
MRCGLEVTPHYPQEKRGDSIMPDISWLGVVAAAVASFAVGAVWYSPVMFAGVWQRESKVVMGPGNGPGMGTILAAAFVLHLLASIAFAMFLGVRPGLQFGAGAGFAAGLFWVAGAFGVNYLFERRSFKLWLINGGYNVVAFTVLGAVLGVL